MPARPARAISPFSPHSATPLSSLAPPSRVQQLRFCEPASTRHLWRRRRAHCWVLRLLVRAPGEAQTSALGRTPDPPPTSSSQRGLERAHWLFGTVLFVRLFACRSTGPSAETRFTAASDRGRSRTGRERRSFSREPVAPSCATNPLVGTLQPVTRPLPGPACAAIDGSPFFSGNEIGAQKRWKI